MEINENKKQQQKIGMEYEKKKGEGEIKGHTKKGKKSELDA